MKKIVLMATVGLLVLAGCGQSKKAAKAGEEEIKITSTLPILTEKTDENTVQKKRLEFPTTADGTSTTQILTYQGDTYLTFEHEVISPLTDELKDSVAQVGVEETNKRLQESLAEDESYKAAKEVRGFSNQVELIDDQHFRNLSTYNLQDLDLDGIRNNPYFKSSGVVEMLDVTPSKYLEVRQSGGAVVTDAP